MGLSVVPDPDEGPWEYPAPEGGHVAKKDSPLGDAAAEALDGDELSLTQDQGGQEALLPACKVKFQGMSFDSMDEVPKLDEEMTFLVRGRVVAHETIRRKDGELREVAKVDVTSVQLAE